MSKFCTSCGKELEAGTKFCHKCGAAVFSISAEAKASPNDIMPHKDFLISKATEKIKEESNNKANHYVEKIFSDTVPAYELAGEIGLPLELAPFTTDFDGDGLFSVLKSGLGGLMGGFKRTLGDKKRITLVIALTIIWLLVNLLAALGIFPLPLRLLSWLTAAQGNLIGGTIGKGLVAALLAQIIVHKGMLTVLKSGLGQLGSILKSGKGKAVPLLLGSGAVLIVCNMMVSTNLQNTMVCIAGFTLSVKTLTQNGFLRRLIMGLLPKAKDVTITTIMGGWTLGFALFAVVSLLPGGRNGYLLGILLLVVGSILVITGRNKKGVMAE